MGEGCREKFYAADTDVFGSIREISLGLNLGANHSSGGEIFQFNEDRYRHAVIIGSTGTGKSNHILQLERQDIRNGAGIAIIAAHDEDALYPLSCVPQWRKDDVILLDATNVDMLPCLNPFDVNVADKRQVSKAVSDILELITDDMRSDFAGPRFMGMARNAIRLLFEGPEKHRCIASLKRLYEDPEFVKKCLSYCSDKTVYDYWTKEIPSLMRSTDSGDVVHWFTSKIAPFETDDVLSRMFSSGKRSISFNDIVDKGKIFIAYIPESIIGRDAARFAAKWMLRLIRDAIVNRRARAGAVDDYLGSFGRSDTLQDADMDPFFVYVDEFAKYASTDFCSLLAESRKYHAGFTLAFQTLSQTIVFDGRCNQSSQGLRDAILGNMGTMICYPVGSIDAETISSQFGVDKNKISEIERYRPLAIASFDNQKYGPFTLKVDEKPAPDNPEICQEIVLSQIRKGYWMPRTPEAEQFALSLEERKSAEIQII